MTCCPAPVAEHELENSSARGRARLEEDSALQHSLELEDGKLRTDFVVESMHCAGCISRIEREVARLAFVDQVRANLSLRTVTIIWRPKDGSALALSARLEELGFSNHLADLTGELSGGGKELKRLLLCLAVAGFAAANVMLLSVSVWSGADAETAQLFHLISGLIAVPAVAFAGQPFFRSAFRALASRRVNMDVPISLAVLLALGMSIYESMTGGHESYFDASVTLLFFLLAGRTLDQMMRQRARGAVERIVSLSAKAGVRINGDGSLDNVPLKDITPGMALRVFAGERFPVNARITSGATHLDRSHVNGESDSVAARAGDTIEAGCLNLSAPVDVEATSTADGSFLAEMRKMIEVAEHGRSQYVRVADRMARIYAPAVHTLAFIAFVGWMIASGGDWHTSIYTAIAVLIITCPCALGLAVPVAHVIGASKLMQNGILLRDGTGLERLARVDTVLLDKTGTLTTGATTVRPRGRICDEERALIKALAATSSHPRAAALSTWLGEQAPADVKRIREHAGLGLEARLGNKRVRLGRPDWVKEIAGAAKADTADASIAFCVAGQELVLFDLREELRPGAQGAVAELTRFALPAAIVSGDRNSKAQCMARLAGIKQVHAELDPAGKIALVDAATAGGKHPLMVGDGMNDGPALAAGYASMAPASGSDVGRQAADFVFTGGSLMAVPVAVKIARATQAVVRQNFALAIAYNCIAIPLAMAGLVTPLIAAIAMSASSLLVVANSMRINLVRTPAAAAADGEPAADNVISLEGAARA